MLTKIDVQLDDIFDDILDEGLKAIGDMPMHLVKDDLPFRLATTYPQGSYHRMGTYSDYKQEGVNSNILDVVEQNDKWLIYTNLQYQYATNLRVFYNEKKNAHPSYVKLLDRIKSNRNITNEKAECIFSYKSPQLDTHSHVDKYPPEVFHLILKSNDANLFYYGDDLQYCTNVKEKELWMLEPQKLHRVVNLSNDKTVLHMIINFLKD